MTMATIPSSTINHRSLRVYITDDEFFSIELLKGLLSKSEIQIVGDNTCALQAFNDIVEESCDVLLADIRFSEDQNAGVELVKRIHENMVSQQRRIPFVIFVTALSEIEAQRATAEIPFSTIVCKPVRKDLLRVAIDEAGLQVRQFRQLTDAQWALKSLGSGDFDALAGDFIGVFDREVVAIGDDETEVRLKVSVARGVPKDEVIVEYKGETQ